MTEPIDRFRLADLVSGSEQPKAAFLADFRRAVDTDVQLLLNAAKSADFARVGELAHRIEGAARVIGAEPFALACKVVAQAGDPGVLRAALAAFVESRDTLYAFIQTLITAVPAPANGGGGPICEGLVFLVVEDHEFQRGLIVRLLRQLGALAVHAFADGASALAEARELRSPAILVLDLAMPGLDGMEVMRIAGLEKLPLAVIVNSAGGDDLLRCVDTARSRGATVLGAVSKPLTAAKLAPLLSQHRHDQRQDAPRLPFGGRPGEHRVAKPDWVGQVPTAGPVVP